MAAREASRAGQMISYRSFFLLSCRSSRVAPTWRLLTNLENLGETLFLITREGKTAQNQILARLFIHQTSIKSWLRIFFNGATE